MDIKYVTSYTDHGCNIHGKLAVIDYSKLAEEITASKPLGGFNSGAFITALEEAKALMNARHLTYSVKLGVPELVVEIPEDEWQEWSQK